MLSALAAWRRPMRSRMSGWRPSAIPDASGSEIALARSAAPAAISDKATVLTLDSHGYQTAARGTNGFTCLVERAWMAPFGVRISGIRRSRDRFATTQQLQIHPRVYAPADEAGARRGLEGKDSRGGSRRARAQ